MTVLLVGSCLLAVQVGRAVYFDTVVGPPPEEVEEHCRPVVEWILSEMERTGKAPEQISSEHAAKLSELPYTWHYYVDGWLTIGRIDKEWPLPLYLYSWEPNDGWSWWADCPEEEIRGVLEDHGYYR